jgi:hypothetical protein
MNSMSGLQQPHKITVLHLNYGLAPEERMEACMPRVPDARAAMDNGTYDELVSRARAETALRLLERAGYHVAAVLRGVSLDEAWTLTQNIDDSWSRRSDDRIRAAGPGFISRHGNEFGYKSSEMGDVMIVDDAQVYVIDTIGFTPVPVAADRLATLLQGLAQGPDLLHPAKPAAVLDVGGERISFDSDSRYRDPATNKPLRSAKLFFGNGFGIEVHRVRGALYDDVDYLIDVLQGDADSHSAADNEKHPYFTARSDDDLACVVEEVRAKEGPEQIRRP